MRDVAANRSTRLDYKLYIVHCTLYKEDDAMRSAAALEKPFAPPCPVPVRLACHASTAMLHLFTRYVCWR